MTQNGTLQCGNRGDNSPHIPAGMLKISGQIQTQQVHLQVLCQS